MVATDLDERKAEICWSAPRELMGTSAIVTAPASERPFLDLNLSPYHVIESCPYPTHGGPIGKFYRTANSPKTPQRYNRK